MEIVTGNVQIHSLLDSVSNNSDKVSYSGNIASFCHLLTLVKTLKSLDDRFIFESEMIYIKKEEDK